MSFRRLCAVLPLLALAATAAFAQDYPVRPIVIIVPFPAGGPTDTLARALGAAMTPTLKQQLVIENSGGAGGTIGINRVAKARNDGYTLLLMHVGIATAPAFYRKLPYDTINDFEPVGMVVDVPMTLIAKKSLPPDSLKDFIDYAKANRDKLIYANAGVGSTSHLCGLLFMNAIGIDFTTVPYKGNAPMMNDLLGGQIDFTCDQTTSTTSQIRSGAIKTYGVTSKARLPSLPDLPTLAEQGLAGFEATAWYGMWVPRGTPKPAVDKLTEALQVALKDQTLAARLADLSAVPVASALANPEALRAHLAAEIDKWGPVIRKAGVYAD